MHQTLFVLLLLFDTWLRLFSWLKLFAGNLYKMVEVNMRFFYNLQYENVKIAHAKLYIT